MNRNPSYKQGVKEQSRIEIWTKAINKLTTQREKQRVLNPSYIRRLWDYAFDEVLKSSYDPDEKFIESWIDFSNNLYESKSPQNLKVAYFCGPEPENDLAIMLGLGVLIENVWAIESDKKAYESALDKAKIQYPTLKIFNGSISELIKITSFKFDIIYLDFTAPLFSKQSKPLLTINSIFETDALSDLGILVVNSAIPEKTEENIQFLASYFRSHPFVEADVLLGPQEDTWFTEGVDSNGFIDQESYKIAESEGYLDDVKDDPLYEVVLAENFEAAYSAFSSHYPTMIAGYVQPMWRVANSSVLKKMVFSSSEEYIKECIKKMETSQDGCIWEEHESFPIWNFINRLKNSHYPLFQYWSQQFIQKNGAASLLYSVQLYDLLRNAEYHYKDVLADTLSKSIDSVIDALPDSNGGVFCDVPLPHLWIELVLNHLGNAYHANTNMHWRAKYKAKDRVMFLDMFVFDSCRSLYNWLPMVNLYGQDMASIERQIIVRSCMDAITKQNHYSSFFSYFGANLIGINTKRWSDLGELKERQDLGNEY